MNGRPDRPLVVKCAFDRHAKKISFSSSRNCSYGLLKAKIDQCFSLYSASYSISYKDDDGEVSEISTDVDLTDAILYFQAGTDDPPMSSAMSVLSGRSFGAKRITLRVYITVDYDGPSLSDTSSLVSMDEYRDRDRIPALSAYDIGQLSRTVDESDDDSKTVSSKDAVGPAVRTYNSEQALSAWDENEEQQGENDDPDPQAVFARLKSAEQRQDGIPQSRSPLSDQWLRDQKSRTLHTMLGGLAAPSDSDSASVSIEGDLALRRDPRGKYYYEQSAPSQSIDSGEDEQQPSILEDWEEHSAEQPTFQQRPNSMHLNWLAAQQSRLQPPEDAARGSRSSSSGSSGSVSDKSLGKLVMTVIPPPPPPPEWESIPEDIPPEVLQFVPFDPPPDHELTDCSACGILLDTIRYVCASCGPKISVSRQADDDTRTRINGMSEYASGSSTTLFQYPPQAHRSPSQNSSSPESSRTVIGETLRLDPSLLQKALPLLPADQSSPFSDGGSNSSSSSSHPGSSRDGYELCPSCIENVGVMHALEFSLARPGGPASPGSPEDMHGLSLSQWRRSAPRTKGTLRHVFLEKVWGHRGWADVEQDDTITCHCSTCNAELKNGKRYKCASCISFNLCRACYSQVHEVHPSHTFLAIPDKPRPQSQPRSRRPSEQEQRLITFPSPSSGGDDEDDHQRSMTHPGVKCAHCLLDIVGARFHCTQCDDIDICSNCESVGLPGNLDSADGGHNSSHIMLKIPFPLETQQVQTMSQRAINLWTDRDAPNVVPGYRPRADSLKSSYARTVVGSFGDSAHESEDVIGGTGDHHMNCNACRQPILGVRYQCASCPSIPEPFNLCATCEEVSWDKHDPMHIFLKLPRPLTRLIKALAPLFPSVYRIAAGPPQGRYDQSRGTLYHASAVCDRCMSRIEGVWYHCAYCPKDLCSHCEELDTHDDTHVFLVLKSTVNMQNSHFMYEDPADFRPIIPHPVYR